MSSDHFNALSRRLFLGATAFGAAGPPAPQAALSAPGGRSVSISDYGASGEGEGDDTAALRAAITAAGSAARDGAVGVVQLPAGVYRISDTIRIPDRIRLVGAGRRATIINTIHGGLAMLEIDGGTYCGLSGVRLGLGKAANTIGIDIKATSVSSLYSVIQDIEIAGGGDGVRNQIGIRLKTTGRNIICGTVVNAVLLSGIDQPFVEDGPEGNVFSAITIDQWGYQRGVAAVSSTGLTNYYQMRIAGAPQAGCVAFRQTGFRNIAMLAVDIGPNSVALEVSARGGNIILMQRPETLTPLGRVGAGNTILDSEVTLLPRAASTGTRATRPQFRLDEGWGQGAQIVDIRGSDATVAFTVVAGDAGFRDAPEVFFEFSDGAWARDLPLVSVSRRGGDQPVASALEIEESLNGWSFAWGGRARAGERYRFIVGSA